jgi:hypothetical protein
MSLLCFAQKRSKKLAFNLSNKDHRRLDEMLGAIIDAYFNGEVPRSEAIGALAHIFTAAMVDKEGEVLGWLDPEDSKTQENTFGAVGNVDLAAFARRRLLG